MLRADWNQYSLLKTKCLNINFPDLNWKKNNQITATHKNILNNNSSEDLEEDLTSENSTSLMLFGLFL